MTLLHVEPQDVAILTTMITVSSIGRPTLFFYIQEDNNTFVSASTLSSAIQVSKHIMYKLTPFTCMAHCTLFLFYMHGSMYIYYVHINLGSGCK